MISDVVQDTFPSSHYYVVQFYAVIFTSPSSILLGSQYIYSTSSLYFPLLAEKNAIFTKPIQGIVMSILV